MHELVRLLVLLGAAGIVLTVAGAVAIWHADEGRRIRRGLKVILKGDLHGHLVARGRGRGMGFNFASNQLAVAWDHGAWGLVYRLDELVGAEVIADGVIVGRTHRGETRRALDSLGGAEHRVALRLIFDDLTHPEFVLDLWLATDETRRGAFTASEALEECNRWLARIEALFRRPMSPRPASRVAAPPALSPAPTVTSPEPEAAGAAIVDSAEGDEKPF
ncbi:MAG TPA: hypothetical protein VHN73_06910 [Phenylobacterium sp.]|nr:hypothetical protein [Phenylobacterium sp.]